MLKVLISGAYCSLIVSNKKTSIIIVTNTNDEIKLSFGLLPGY